MVVQLRHRTHCGPAGAYGVGLVNGDSRGHALYLVDRWFVHTVQKLARVRGKGFHITALAFGIQRVKHQAGLAGAAGASHHRQFAGADIQIQILQIVLARAANADGSLGHGVLSFCVRPVILGTYARADWRRVLC